MVLPLMRQGLQLCPSFQPSSGLATDWSNTCIFQLISLLKHMCISTPNLGQFGYLSIIMLTTSFELSCMVSTIFSIREYSSREYSSFVLATVISPRRFIPISWHIRAQVTSTLLYAKTYLSVDTYWTTLDRFPMYITWTFVFIWLHCT